MSLSLLRTWLVSGLSCVLLLASAHSANARERFPDLSWFGVSMLELRRAHTEIPWDASRSRDQAIDAYYYDLPNYTDLAGMSFDLRIMEAYGLLAAMILSHDEPAEDAAACEHSGLLVGAALEPHIGTLFWPHALSEGQEQVRVAERSIMIVQGWRERGHLLPELAPRQSYNDRRTTGFAIRARAAPRVGQHIAPTEVRTDLRGETCRIQVWISAPAEVPEN